VIQSAIDASSIEGGTIFIKPGIYRIKETLSLCSKVELVGTRATVLESLVDDDYVVKIEGTLAERVAECGIFNMHIRSPDRTPVRHGILIRCAKTIRFAWLEIDGFRGYAICQESDWDSKFFNIDIWECGDTNVPSWYATVFDTEPTNHADIIGLEITAKYSNGFQMDGVDNMEFVNLKVNLLNPFTGVHATTKTGLPYITRSLSFTGCSFFKEGVQGGNGFYGNGIEEILFVNCFFENLLKGITGGAAPVSPIVVLGCDFREVATPFDAYSPIKIVRHNLRYVTENSGVTTITGDGITTSFTVDVSHELISDKASIKIGCKKPASYKWYLVDMDGDNFFETLRIVITFDTAPALDEVVEIYWEANVI